MCVLYTYVTLQHARWHTGDPKSPGSGGVTCLSFGIGNEKARRERRESLFCRGHSWSNRSVVEGTFQPTLEESTVILSLIIMMRITEQSGYSDHDIRIYRDLVTNLLTYPSPYTSIHHGAAVSVLPYDSLDMSSHFVFPKPFVTQKPIQCST